MNATSPLPTKNKNFGEQLLSRVHLLILKIIATVSVTQKKNAVGSQLPSERIKI
jgi:hypothetical protein